MILACTTLANSYHEWARSNKPASVFSACSSHPVFCLFLAALECAEMNQLATRISADDSGAHYACEQLSRIGMILFRSCDLISSSHHFLFRINFLVSLLNHHQVHLISQTEVHTTHQSGTMAIKVLIGLEILISQLSHDSPKFSFFCL